KLCACLGHFIFPNDVTDIPFTRRRNDALLLEYVLSDLFYAAVRVRFLRVTRQCHRPFSVILHHDLKQEKPLRLPVGS
ncbi:MAG: hypothetical protein LUG61_02355, partial [Lachnospiraceae bacterium]|nr:hypothetical protein [Lachnospiraceae bacterium]